jgi:hypothetical protein
MIFIENFIDLFVESAPWLVLGFAIAGLIKGLVPEDFLSRHLGGRGAWTTVKAAIIGAPLPLCSCGVVPAALGLRKAGASKNATVSFLVATPETGVDSVSVTYALMGPFLAIIRPIAAISSGILSGLLVGRVDEHATSSSHAAAKQSSCCARESTASSSKCGTANPEKASPSCCSSSHQAETTSCCSEPKKTEDSSDCCSSKQATNAGLSQKLLGGLRFSFDDMLKDISLWLLVGLLFAAAVRTWVPESFLAQWGDGWMAFLVMAVVGIPMYICATASTPIAAGLLMSGISPGAVLVFMMAGPATNIGTLGIIGKELGKRALIAYLTGVMIAAFFFGYLTNALVTWLNIDISTQAHGTHDMVPGLLAYALSALLAVAIARSLFQKYARLA